jgi:CRISPR-associated protein Csx3
MNLLPALVIGGRPHAGKSVLAFSLSQALRLLKIQHYVLRAYPDGEGDWANQASQELVRAIRVKGEGTPEWVEHICRDIGRRHLPLIVDPGGRPTDWQEAVFDECTHAILLWPDDGSRGTWEAMLKRHGLAIVADLRSDLHGVDDLEDNGPMLRGTLAGLERGAMAGGLAFEALVECVAGLFSYSPSELRKMHLAQAPVELVIELGRLGRTLDALDSALEWVPQHLPRVLDYLPSATPLGLYDRGPNWLYAALALYAHPEPLYQFDVRLGWIKPPALRIGQPTQDAPLQANLSSRSDHVRVELALRDAYLDYAEAEGLCVPPVPADRGIVLSGKLPLWLWTATSLAYPSVPWLGIYQPRLHDRAVIVKSQIVELAVGQTIRSAPVPANA